MISLRQLVLASASLAVAAALALVVVHVASTARGEHPLLEAARSISSLEPVQMPDYIRIASYPAYYVMIGDLKTLEAECPAGYRCTPVYYLVLGVNKTAVRPPPAYYTPSNATIIGDGYAVIAPFWAGGRVYSFVATCKGGFGFRELEIEAESVVVVLVYCS